MSPWNRPGSTGSRSGTCWKTASRSSWSTRRKAKGVGSRIDSAPDAFPLPYQETHYVYGVTTAGGSGVNSNDILSATQYPDPYSDQLSSQLDTYLANALGDVVQSTDRNGNVHQYSYDTLGRLTSDAVTTLGAGVDGTVRRITYGYDSQGNPSLITSYNAASGGSIVNQVQDVYNGLDQLTGEYQSHSGAVVQGSTPEVQYAYNEMSNGENNSRLVSMTYPNGYVLNYNYSSGLNDSISRLSSLSDSSGTVESYLYLGLNTVVERDHPQTGINLSYLKQSGDTQYNGDGGDQYTGLDRFGRIIDQFWINASTNTTVDRYQYGYDPDSEVLYRQNLADAAMSELYSYDKLGQLASFQRGTLNSSHNGISGTPSRSQSWSPDALGNFTNVTTNGTAQTRTANQQNEYTSISGSGTVGAKRGRDSRRQGLNSNDILSATQYPDPYSDQLSSQQDNYLANALGDVVQSTDRNGNVHQYSYDTLGRLTSDAVTTLGTGVDGAVRRITYGYDSQGNQSLITSYDVASGGNIVNQVQRVYNGLGQLTGEYQSHNGAVVPGTTPQVQYAYNEMSNGENNSRLVSMTYPNGYTLNYNYSSGLNDGISRLSSLSDSSGTLESYLYLGLNTVVERDHPQTGINLSYLKQSGDTQYNGDGGDQYTGLDRFGRVIDQFWINASNGTTVDRYQYGYDPDSEVLYRQNLVDAAMSELYSYDKLGQLASFQRGTLNSSHNGIVGTPSRSQIWTPDALGNFTNVATNGTAQTRTANQQNEYTSISGSGTLSYDANGNLTADGAGNTYVYDAWNRLVTVKNGSTTVASYHYDGLGRLIQVTDGGTTTDLYLSSADQVLAEYQGSTVTAYNVWSPVYVNALVFRAINQGSWQRLYAVQDANWNVTALVNGTGGVVVVERYAYDPYGAITVMSSGWVVQTSSNYNVPTMWQGMRYDWSENLYVTPSGRFVSPTLMRPLQPDPIGQAADVDLYRWQDNQPT